MDSLVLVGSRLQALILLGVSAACLAAVDHWASYVAAVVLSLRAVAILVSRTELRDATVLVRRITGRRELATGGIDPTLGHRYLTLRTNERSYRIEVPVEIRPNVRAWVEALTLD